MWWSDHRFIQEIEHSEAEAWRRVGNGEVEGETVVDF